MNYLELLSIANEKKYMTILVSAGCDHKPVNNLSYDKSYSGLFNKICSKIKTLQDNLIAKNTPYTQYELKQLFLEHFKNSTHCEYIPISNLMQGLQDVLGKEDYRDTLKTIISKYTHYDLEKDNIKSDNKHVSIISLDVTGFLLKYEYNKEEVITSTINASIQTLNNDYQEKLDFNFITSKVTQSAYPIMDIFIQSKTEKPVNSEIFKELFDKILATKPGFNQANCIEDFYLYCKMKHTLEDKGRALPKPKI